ncbi:MAG: OmpH family outer membrane protein [Candidatus Acidiferrales bacterium]
MNVHFSLKHVPAALLVVFLFATGAWAQGGAAAAAPPATKIVALDVQGAIAATAEGKEAAIELQSKFAPKETQLQDIQKNIEDIQNRLQNGQATLSDEEKSSLQRQGELYSHELQRGQDDLQEQVTADRQDVVDRIGRKLLDVVDRYARENGIAMVLDSSVQGGSLLYRSPQVDITNDIVRLYDQAYPVKPATAATPPASHAPATPKPATPPQR